jgi:DNA repair photolyase
VNPAGRFEPRRVEAVWDDLDGGEDDVPVGPATDVYVDHARTVLTRNDSPDVPFDVSLNPYRGCEHGCSYCFARATHPFLNLSAGLDFETKIFAKLDAAALLRREIAKPRYVCRPIAFGTNTDPYQPIERKLAITRRCLEVLVEFRQPVLVITKNHLVTRDADLLTELARHRATAVYLSVTTLDAALARRLEPRTSSPAKRLEAIASLSAAGVPTGVLVAPVVPGITDHEMPKILEAAAQAGATSAGYVILRLPFGLKSLFEGWLDAHEPEKKDKVLSRLRELSEGKLYNSQWSKRQTGSGVYAEQVAQIFRVACARHGLDQNRETVSTAAFRRPPRAGDQGELFG